MMAIPYPEERDAMRTGHNSPLQVKDLSSGEIYEGRMFNYSDSGIYFESDGVFQKGASIYICIRSYRDSRSSGVLEYYNSQVVWCKELKQSLFKYGYGIQFVSDATKQGSDAKRSKKAKDLREHPRRPFFRTIRFGTRKGDFKGSTKNISASGVFITTEEKLEVGQLLKLNLPLKRGKTAEILGQIVRLDQEGFGLKFKKII